MPLLKLQTTVVLSAGRQESLLRDLSALVAQVIGKPEQYVMVTAETSAMRMAGKAGDAEFVEVRSIGGLGGAVNRELSQKICQKLEQTLGISPERVYLNFAEIKAADWGWNGTTFG